MLRKCSVFLPIVLILSFVFAPSLNVSATPNRQDDVLKIGLLTDSSNALAVYGIELQNGLTLGLQYATEGTLEVGGRQIEVIVRDYANDPELAATQAQELIEVEGVEVLVGAPSSAATQGLVQIAADYGVVLMAGPAAAKNITGELFQPTTFRACRSSWHDAAVLGPYWKEAIGDTYIQFAADYAFGREEAEAFDYMLQQNGVTPAAETIYGPLDTSDFVPYLTQIKESGASGVIYIWAGAGTIPLVQQIAESGLTDTMPAMAFFNSNDIQLAFAAAQEIPADGFIVYHYSLPDNEVNDWMVEEHKAQFGGDVPDLFTECGFATAQALVAGLQKTEGSTATEDLIPALEGLEWEGPKGHYVMRAEDHQALMPMYAVRLTNLTDPEFKFYELLDTIEITDLPCEAGADRSSDTLDCTPLAERAE
ncbi:MAG TPA: substrate-binding domain-containing protein [Aggregatilineaceae bacterium]|nr:substrate-binding domain-containing protein [Aggregatilineaceae bacterium]